MEIIFLKCFRVGRKLRIRIISPNYYNNHYCRFPKNIRIENKVYQVPADDITLVSTICNNSYYSIKTKRLKILDDDDDTVEFVNSSINTSIQKIFTNEDETDENKDICVVCLEKQKYYVFGPCGHFYTCETCSNQLNSCPICRSKIKFKIPYTSLNN